MGGSRKDRQKFLRKNSKIKTIEIDINDPDQVEKVGTSKTLLTMDPSKLDTKKNGNGKTKVESIVEEAVDATL